MINSHRIVLAHQPRRHFMFWNTNMAAVTPCENALLKYGLASRADTGT